MTPPLVDIRALGFRYPDGTPALDGVSLAIARGERVAVLGPTGSGKSTLLQHLNGLLRPTVGGVWIEGVAVEGSPALSEIRRQVGLVFQDPNDQLFLPTLLEDVAFGPLNDGVSPVDAAARATTILRELGLDGVGARAAHHLSGGERRLAALATVLVSRPVVLALDEPTGDLDARGRKRLVDLLRARGETLLVATHDLTLARALCGRGVVLYDGRVVADRALGALLADQALLERYGLESPLGG